MNTFSLANSLSVSVRIYRALLVAYPKKFREHYEVQMVQVFRDSIREAYHHNGIPGLVDLWIHTLFDLVFTALNEHIMERSQVMVSPKVILWGGVASICGGLFWVLAAFQSGGAAPLELGLVLGLGGLFGLYSRQGGRFALVGLVLGIIGTGLALADLWWAVSNTNLELDPVGTAPVILILSLGMLILGIGLVLLGIISLRTMTPQHWRGLPLGVGLMNIVSGMTFWLAYYLPLSQGRNPWNPWSIEVYVLFPAVHLLLGFGWMALGVMLAIEGDAQIPVAQPPPDSA